MTPDHASRTEILCIQVVVDAFYLDISTKCVHLTNRKYDPRPLRGRTSFIMEHCLFQNVSRYASGESGLLWACSLNVKRLDDLGTLRSLEPIGALLC
ncbi:hypothetical protein MRB53_034334 [Persea americana]|uniref:Uncharacterized protein n=1 Tax=Persea americana TaxID=3435 RepID=A0ACC2KX60_PERAE|nr:hypothetical protein MRB53_034334 [Persea americana]